MPDAKTDQNHVAVGMCRDADDATLNAPVCVEPVTGRLQVDLTVDPTLPASLSLTSKNDANFTHTAYGVTDDAAMDIVPIAVDADGNVLIDIIEG